MTTIAEIPEDELRYWSMTVFKDENGELLFEMQHDSEIDWERPDFKSISLSEVFSIMRPAS
jgi:hypothetical protein